jgi:urea transporter
MQAIRKYLLPTVLPLLAASRMWLIKSFGVTADTINIDLAFVSVFFVLMALAWCCWFRTLSQMTWQMIIGVSMGVFAAILTQVWLMAVELILTTNPMFFFSIMPLIGNRTSEFLGNVTKNYFSE